jgi:isopentenyl-diphosphate delta-isomerase
MNLRYGFGMQRTVTLVDENGKSIGMADLRDAHTGKGKLHRAFSVYIFRNLRREILIQRRSAGKMLWPMIWANSCCSHPFENEEAMAAGMRRLQEELGFTCPLQAEGTFVYRALDPTGRGVEHEHVTILTGDAPHDVAVQPDPKEVAQWKWIEVDLLQEDMQKNTDLYTPWFHLGLDLLLHS